jgi:polyribonucleotide nucleotidyltransferase
VKKAVGKDSGRRLHACRGKAETRRRPGRRQDARPSTTFAKSDTDPAGIDPLKLVSVFKELESKIVRWNSSTPRSASTAAT